jgi:hypothetical protein
MAHEDWDEKAWDRGLDLADAVRHVDGVDYFNPSITRFTFNHLKETVAQSIENLLRIQKMQLSIEKKRKFE